MWRRACDSMSERIGLACALIAVCATAAADQRVPIAIPELEYFPAHVEDRPPPADAVGALTTNGVIRSAGSKARSTSWLRSRSRPVVRGPDSNRSAEAWLRGRFELRAEPDGVQALYISAATRGVRAFVNGAEIGSSSLSDAQQFGSNYPLFFTIPPSLLQAGGNTVDLQLSLTAGGWGYVRGVALGHHGTLKPQYDQVLFWRVTGPQITSLIAVLAGAIACLVWLRRRDETAFAWFALACLMAAFRNASFFVWLPSIEGWYEVWAAVSLHWMSVALALFSFRLCQRRFPRIERALLWSALAWTAVLVPNGRFTLTAVDIGNLWLVAVNLGILGFVLTECLRRATVDRVLLLVAVTVTLAFGAMDLMMFLGLRASEWRVHLLPYSTLFFSLVMGAVLVDAFAKARARQDQINRELDARLAVRERQLEEQHQALLRLETERATSNERQRIVRDMHDGLGSQLISSIHLVEAGALEPAKVAMLLRECVDDLRLAIDSLKPAGNDLLAVLGNFRYRMEPRLLQTGVRLEWIVSPQARSPELSAEQVLHALRIVQEAVTNALKHAHPSRLRLSYTDETDSAGWELSVEDDGIGLAEVPERQHGDGLNNMRSRAEQAGLDLAIEGRQGGTRVSLRPQQRRGATGR
jgi:signal transduction histidine kinase